jgi:very-short-patch-repair endonuclease
VEDRRNILVVMPHHHLGVLEETTMHTLQYTLKRGIEAVYQLEESELMAEPLPGRDNRQSILFFEAAEGGAGVLTRLATEPQALRAVAAQALSIMHFQPPAQGKAWKKSELTQELDEHGHLLCEAGCYRCLLSYYNQPDHPLIDRQDKQAGGQLLDILCRLTESESALGSQGRAPEQHTAELERMSSSALEKAWLTYVREHGYLKPDRAQHTITAAGINVDFFYDDYSLAVFIDGPSHDSDSQKAKDAEASRTLEDLGLIVVRFPKEQEQWPAIFKANADLFGPGQKN